MPSSQVINAPKFVRAYRKDSDNTISKIVPSTDPDKWTFKNSSIYATKNPIITEEINTLKTALDELFKLAMQTKK